MFPWQPPDAPRTRELKAFNNEVFEQGGIYVAVRNKDNLRELQTPWKDAAQERTARLYASGSIAVFDHDRRTLIRQELSLATVLHQIISGERVLAQADVLTKRTGREDRALVWVQGDDLARAENAQEERRRCASPTSGNARVHRTHPPAVSQFEPEGESTEEEHIQPLSVDITASGESAAMIPSPASAGPPDRLAPPAASAPTVNDAVPITRSSKNQQPAPRRPWWKAIADWFHRV